MLQYFCQKGFFNYLGLKRASTETLESHASKPRLTDSQNSLTESCYFDAMDEDVAEENEEEMNEEKQVANEQVANEQVEEEQVEEEQSGEELDEEEQVEEELVEEEEAEEFLEPDDPPEDLEKEEKMDPTYCPVVLRRSKRKNKGTRMSIP